LLLILVNIESDDWPCSSKCPWPLDKLINCRVKYELKVRGSNKKELKINNRSHSLTLCFNRWFSSISWCSCKLTKNKENWITESTDHDNRLIVQNNMVTMHISSCTSYGASCTVIFTNFAWIFYLFSLSKSEVTLDLRASTSFRIFSPWNTLKLKHVCEVLNKVFSVYMRCRTIYKN
jgi:hypothetical protein